MLADKLNVGQIALGGDVSSWFFVLEVNKAF